MKMTETVSVSVSGAAFSLVFYENIKSEHDQEGFLLGNILSKETNKLTDADHRVLNREHVIKIKSALPCPQQFYFYNASGEIDANKIRAFLNTHDNVVGWFLFKRKRTLAKLTLREKIIHKQLANLFSSCMPFFSCCLLTSDNISIKPTYSFCQTFVRYHKVRYESLPLHVINLSDPSHTFKIAEPTSEIFNKIIKSVKRSGESQGHLIMKKVQEDLQHHMKNLVIESTEKEQQLFKLEQEVKQLKYNLRQKREFSTLDQENNLNFPEIEVTENRLSDLMESESSDNMQNIPECSLDNSRKKKNRLRKPNNLTQQNCVSPALNCDNVDVNLKESEVTLVASKLRPKAQISYSEMAQKRKN